MCVRIILYSRFQFDYVLTEGTPLQKEKAVIEYPLELLRHWFVSLEDNKHA